MLGVPVPDERPLSALPSPKARALAFVAILVAGLCGAMIGWSFVDLQCEGSCAGPSGIGAVVGGVGNRLMGKKIVANARNAFGAPPPRWPATLHVLPAARP